MPGTNRPVRNGGGKSSDDSSDFFTLDAVLQCLVHPRRRHILYLLQDTPIVTEADLANHLALLETEESTGEILDKTLEGIRIELRQNHLPHLEDARLIEYDRRSETVRYTDPPKLLELALRFTERFETNDTKE